MQQLPRFGDAEKRVLRAGMDDWFTPTLLSELGGRAMHRRHPKCIIFIFIQDEVAKPRFANVRRVLKQSLEHRF